MQMLEQLNAAMGEPLLLKAVDLGSGGSAKVARWRHSGGRIEVAAGDAVRVSIGLCQVPRFRWAGGGLAVDCAVEIGSISVYSPNEPVSLQIDGPSDVFQVMIEPELLDVLVEKSARVTRRFGVNDAAMQRSALRALVAASRGEPDDPLLLEASVASLAGLVVEYSDPPRSPRALDGLSLASKRRVEALVADRLTQPMQKLLCLTDMAEAAGLSIHHFIKMFQRSYGTTPYAFVRCSRLRQAMRLLAGPGLSVAEVADETGFATPAHFVASFHRYSGVTPGAFRRAVIG